MFGHIADDQEYTDADRGGDTDAQARPAAVVAAQRAGRFPTYTPHLMADCGERWDGMFAVEIGSGWRVFQQFLRGTQLTVCW